MPRDEANTSDGEETDGGSSCDGDDEDDHVLRRDDGPDSDGGATLSGAGKGGATSETTNLGAGGAGGGTTSHDTRGQNRGHGRQRVKGVTSTLSRALEQALRKDLQEKPSPSSAARREGSAELLQFCTALQKKLDSKPPGPPPVLHFGVGRSFSLFSHSHGGERNGPRHALRHVSRFNSPSGGGEWERGRSEGVSLERDRLGSMNAARKELEVFSTRKSLTRQGVTCAVGSNTDGGHGFRLSPTSIGGGVSSAPNDEYLRVPSSRSGSG